MSVRKMWLAGEPAKDSEYTAEIVSDNAIEPVGPIHVGADGPTLDPKTLEEGLRRAVEAVALCNVATIHKNLKGEWKSTGDPTEVALQVFATKLSLGRPTLTSDKLGPADAPRLRPAMGEKISGDPSVTFPDEEKEVPKRYTLAVEFPFSSELKRMTTIYFDTEGKGALCIIKGAVSNAHQYWSAFY